MVDFRPGGRGEWGGKGEQRWGKRGGRMGGEGVDTRSKSIQQKMRGKYYLIRNRGGRIEMIEGIEKGEQEGSKLLVLL